MSSLYRNAAPQAVFTGFQDNPLAGRTNSGVVTPQHCPLSFILGAWGSEKEAYYIEDQLETIFGKETFNVQGKLYKHSTDFVQNVFQKNANSQFVIRLKPADATKAYVRIAIEYVLTDQIPVYERNADRSYLLDADGELQQSGTTEGYKWRILAQSITEAEFGQAPSTQEGTLAGKAGEVSSIRPWFDAPASFFGSRGSDIGLRLSAAHGGLLQPGDINFMEDSGNFLYRLGFVERNQTTGDIVEWKTRLGESTVDFCFKENQRNSKNAKLSLDDVYANSYTYTKGATNGRNVAGPIDGYFFYKEVFEETLGVLHAMEKGEESVTHETNVHSINVASAVDFEGMPYYKLMLAPTTELVGDAIQLSRYANIMLAGGSDGDVSETNFDKMVANFLSNFTGQGIDLHDHARYPFTVMYDSGYSIETTKLFYGVTKHCPNLIVITGTQDVNTAINTLTEDMSTASALIASAYLNVESSVYQTPFTRGAVVPYAGHLLNSEYTKLCTTTREIANKFSQWMGSGTGKWNDGKDADIGINRTINTMDIENYQLPPMDVREAMWENQMVAIEFENMTDKIFSGMQTINPNDASILNGLINTWGCVAASRCAYYAYKLLVGNSKYTNEQMQKRAVNMMNTWLNGIGNERLIFRPRVEFTPDNLSEGYSWTTVVEVYAPGMKTVNVITVSSYNISEFEA